MFLKNILIAFVAFQFLAVPILFVMDSQFLQSVLALAIGFAVIYFLCKKYLRTNILEVIKLDQVSSFTMEDLGGGHYKYIVRAARISRRVVVFSAIVALLPTLLAPILAPVFIGLGFFCLSFCMRGAEYRKNTEISITPDQIRTDEYSFAKGEVAEIYCDQLFNQGVGVNITRHGDVYVGNGFLYSYIWDKQADSSYEIGLRTNKSDKVYILAGGLNGKVAKALGGDLADHIFSEQKAA